jgi:hypothetical protein
LTPTSAIRNETVEYLFAGWIGYLIAGFIGACILIAIARAFSGGLQQRNLICVASAPNHSPHSADRPRSSAKGRGLPFRGPPRPESYPRAGRE